MAWSKKNNGVELNSYLERLLDQIAAQLNFDIVVTSGIRSARSQAQAMFNKITDGDTTLKDYRNRDYASEMIAAYPNVTAGTSIVEKYAAAGVASYHLIGRAFDLRTNNLTGAQIATMQNVIAEVVPDSFSLVELIPPHLHVRVPATPKKKYLWIALAIAAILGMKWISKE